MQYAIRDTDTGSAAIFEYRIDLILSVHGGVKITIQAGALDLHEIHHVSQEFLEQFVVVEVCGDSDRHFIVVVNGKGITRVHVLVLVASFSQGRRREVVGPGFRYQQRRLLFPVPARIFQAQVVEIFIQESHESPIGYQSLQGGNGFFKLDVGQNLCQQLIAQSRVVTDPVAGHEMHLGVVQSLSVYPIKFFVVKGAIVAFPKAFSRFFPGRHFSSLPLSLLLLFRAVVARSPRVLCIVVVFIVVIVIVIVVVE
mmetsp:Transcript_1325/g.2978  ORF Transcript_1325/g.2978 Transcript_1325/m.2978 type:complete len:254 (-) Transcript_1325:719-1480(-)